MLENHVLIGQNIDSKVIAELVQKASEFRCHISLVVGNKMANAKSIMGLISINLREGDTVKFIADGADAQDALGALEAILR